MAENGEGQLAERIRGNNFREHLKKTAGNSEFQLRISHVLKELTQDMPKLRVLDYGAGAIPTSVTLTSTIREEQETVAYDPCYEGVQTQKESGIRWTKKLPVKEKFDLAICHFSLHHIDKSPKKVLRELRSYSSIIVVADYDFTKATLAEFKSVFISEPEQEELRVLFGGDWEECFAFHSYYDRFTYEKALKKNGFDTVSESGKGIAKHKFLLIGIPRSPLSKLALSSLK